MTAFVRTASGLTNYHKFYGVDFTVYIEGKLSLDQAEAQRTKPIDVCYFESVMGAARAGKRCKIKTVGNKDTALEYARAIREGGVANSVVIVDKDLEGITSSPMPLFPVVRTFGYSWENELWSVNTISAVLADLTNGNAAATANINENIERLAKRLKYLSILDAASQVGGVSILRKSSSLCGVGFSFPGVSAREVSRVAGKFKNSASSTCPVAKRVVLECKGVEPREIIQGHFWSNVVLRFIAHAYKAITGDTCPSNTLLTNLALANLRRDTPGAVGPDLVARYGLELARFGV